MSLIFHSESQSAFLLSTPIHASQDSFANSPVDCMVPTTPNIACQKYVSDQRVPLTPETQVIHARDVILASDPSTPEIKFDSTPTNGAALCFDNSNESSQNVASSVDQIVPSTPEAKFNATIRQGNCYEQSTSSHFTVEHENSGSCPGESYSFENSVSLPVAAAEYLKRSTNKRLSLTKRGNNFVGTTSTHQNFADTWTSQTAISNDFGNAALALSISESSSPTSHAIYKALPEVSSPVCPNLPSQNGAEPSLSISTLRSVSLTSETRTEASTSMFYLSATVSSTHTRDELTQLRRPFSQIERSHCFHGENINSPFQVTDQLKLFQGDDIFA